MSANPEKRDRNWILYPFLLMCMFLIFAPLLSQAEDRISIEQRSPDSPNPREDVAFLEKEIEDFKLRMLPLLDGKSTEDATAVFFEEVEALYDVVGQPYKWPWANLYDLYIFGVDHNVQWRSTVNYIRGMPTPSDIDEEEAIAIAKKTVLLLTSTSPEELEMYWANTRYQKTDDDRAYSWYVDFVGEPPDETYSYYIRFSLEIDPKTGHIFSFFDSCSNDY